MAVAHRLAQGDEVGGDPEPFERPHAQPGASVASLHLVGDPAPSGGVGELDQLAHVGGGRVEHPVALQHPVEDGGGQAEAPTAQPFDRRDEAVRTEVPAAQHVGRGPPLDMGRSVTRRPRLG
jgi:hypothetical protein